MNAIAREAVASTERRDVFVLDAAQAAGGGRPDRTVGNGLELCNPTRTQSLFGSIRRLDLPILEMQDAAFEKSEPDAASSRIGRQSRGIILVPQREPGESLGYFAAEQMNQTHSDIRDPETPVAFFG